MRHIVKSHRSHPLSQIVNELFDTTMTPRTDRHQPAANITEHDDKYSIELVVPGMAKEDFDIKIEKDQLTISAAIDDKHETTDDTKDDVAKVIRAEYKVQSFSRSFHLSDEINTDAIEARYDLGILRVDLHKKAEVVIPTKKIEIS